MVTTMDKCYTLTALLLVCLVAVVEPNVNTNNEGATKDSMKTLDLRLELLSDTFCDVSSNNQLKKSDKKIQGNKKEISCKSTCLVGDSNRLSQWSKWTDFKASNGIKGRYRIRAVTSTSGEQTCCLPTDISITDKNRCTLYAGDWSDWSSCSEFTSSGERYRQRSFNCIYNHSVCLLTSNTSSFEIISSAQCSGKDNIKEDEKRYTLTEIILVAFVCLLLGVLLSILSFMLYMKRTQKGFFSKHVKECQGDSKQRSCSGLQFLNERVLVRGYDIKDPKSLDSKNENKAEETQYQSLNFDQVDNDQHPYDELEAKEPNSDRHDNQPISSRLKQTGNAEQINHMTNLEHNTEDVYEYCRGSDLRGHNYFILEIDNISRESKARNLGRPETYAEARHEIKDSAMGTEDEQSDAAHEYFVLERVENGHSED